MTVTTYWKSKAVVIDWYLTDPTTKQPADATTVTGQVIQPDGSPAAATVTHPGVGHYLVTFDPAQAGGHAYRLSATGAVDSAEQGVFYVNDDLTGWVPITTDPTSDLGMVRLLIADLDVAEPYFTDAQLTALLTSEGTTRLAAAQALDIIASSEALVSKKIKTQDLQTDGPAVAAELRARAKSLREQNEATLGNDDDAVMAIVDFDPYAAYRDLV